MPETPPEEGMQGGPDAATQGGPDVATQPATQPTFGTKIKVGEQEFVVDETFAKAYEAQQKAFSDQIASQDQKLDELSVTVGRLQNPPDPSPEPTTDPYAELGDLMYSDPARFVKELESRMQKAQARTKQEWAQESEQQENLKRFWGSFWKDHKDLRQDADEDRAKYIADIYARGDTLKGLSEEQISKKIADGVRQLVKEGLERTSTKPTPHVEGGGHQFTQAPPAQESKVSTITDVLNKRAEARREAARQMSTGGTK